MASAGVTSLVTGGLAAGLAMATGDERATGDGDGLGLGIGEGAGREIMAVGVGPSGEPTGAGELVTSLVDGAISGGLLHATSATAAKSSRLRRIKRPPR